MNYWRFVTLLSICIIHSGVNSNSAAKATEINADVQELRKNALNKKLCTFVGKRVEGDRYVIFSYILKKNKHDF